MRHLSPSPSEQVHHPIHIPKLLEVRPADIGRMLIIDVRKEGDGGMSSADDGKREEGAKVPGMEKPFAGGSDAGVEEA